MQKRKIQKEVQNSHLMSIFSKFILGFSIDLFECVKVILEVPRNFTAQIFLKTFGSYLSFVLDLQLERWQSGLMRRS